MRWRPVALVFASTSLLACAAILGIDDGIPRTSDGGDAQPPTDAPASDVVVDAGPCNLAAPFGTPVSLGAVNSSAGEYHPRLSPDELTLYFQRDSATTGFDLYVAKRNGTSFDPPSPIGELDTASQEADLTVAPDGLRAFFASDRGGLGGLDIFQTSRDAQASPFDPPTPTANVSSTQNDNETYYVPGALYFASDRGTGGEDLYRAAEGAGGFASPLLIPELASPAYDGFPVVSLDERRIYFGTTRADAGTYQTYTATRASSSATWSTPEVVAELVSFGNTIPGWISNDGCRLYLSSDHGGDYDLYVATKPK